MSRSRPKKKRKGNGSQIYSITHRLYKEIRENPELIHLKKLRGYQGEYNLVTEDINIDYRKMFFPTLIHEYFHKWNEGKSETWVLLKEREIINKMTARQMINLIRVLAEALSNRLK